MADLKSIHDVQKGDKVKLKVGKETLIALGSARRISGGYVVDVQGKLWNGQPITWSEPLYNLEFVDESQT